jgi:hypothetical protein
VISEMCSQLQRDLTSQQIKLPRCDRFTFGLFENIFAEKISEAATRTALAKAIAALAAGGERHSAAKLYLTPTVLSADLSAASPLHMHEAALRYPSTATKQMYWGFCGRSRSRDKRQFEKD